MLELVKKPATASYEAEPISLMALYHEVVVGVGGVEGVVGVEGIASVSVWLASRPGALRASKEAMYNICGVT